MARTLSLIARNLVFTVVVPGLGGVWVPWSILTRHGGTATPVAWEAVPVIAAGAALYLWCVWNFAAVGNGTPGLWDAPTRVVAAGPYRWVRNPIYIAALLVVLGPAVLAGARRMLGSAGTHPALPLVVVALLGAAAAAILVADLSGMSKAEVERIWLPFAVWLMPACATLRNPRAWLVAQAAVALAVNHLLLTVW